MNDDELLAIVPDNVGGSGFCLERYSQMIDLSGIARQLHLSVDQLRFAADLIEQGFSPTYISRYRADETGALPKSVLWRLKLYLDRQKRLQAARERVSKQVPKEVVLDAEAVRILEHARTEIAMESALRSFRARRILDQSQERDGAAGRLLEKMITYTGPAIDDVTAWAAEQVGGDLSAGQQALSQVSRLLASLIQCDTALIARLRQMIQRRASIRVSDPPAAPAVVTPTATATASPAEATIAATSESSESANSETTPLGTTSSETELATLEATPEVTGDVQANEGADLEGHDDHLDDDHLDSGDDSADHGDAGAESSASDEKGSTSKKASSKMTPRQRRRRWLVSMLAPLKSLNKPVNRLTAFQHLMLGRGVRSQLISTPLDYDRGLLAEIARDSFTDAKHPLAAWFTEATGKALDTGLRHKLEVEALAELEEEASEALLEHATDELRMQLMRRPVRGHTIALVDTVGPKTVVVVVIDAHGNVLATDELPCSVQPEVVNQNVVVLGQMIHKHRVTLVALTNGPVRRFMVATLRELMVQSKDSGLRWTMADRSGAEAYAGGRIGLRELATYNRRERAAIWAARCLQNPLVELLKIDISRLRLGSYQRELPQDVLKQLVTDTIVDCVCSRGIDAVHASETELQYIPGIGQEQAKQIASLASSGQLASRAQLKEAIAGWPEQGLRQAIGWLRVFDSSTTPLDATLIHPDDYRLAERLIENTELSMPASAPPGWVKRVSAAQIAAPASSPEVLAATEDASADAPETSTTDSATTSETEATAESTSTTDNVAEATPAVDEVTVDTTSFAPTQPAEPAAPALPEIAPEYPEQISAAAVAAPLVDAEKLAKQWQVGRAKLKSIAAALQDPFADPRLNGPAVPLRVDLPTLESLEPDTCVWAIVVGVADFGAFVELAPNCSGLIHISRLSMNFIEDPHQCVQVGDLLMTWVVNVDSKKNRVALTALSPAQRAQAAAAAEARKAQIEAEKSQQRGHGGGRGDRGPRRDGPPGKPAQGRHGEGAPQRSGGPATGGRGGQPAGTGSGGGNRRPGGGRPERSGAGGRGGDRDRGRGNQRGGDGGRPAKSVVVTSKKPVAPISQAMKQGEEPLRSFSDLMQFYESKRSPGAEAAEGQPAPQQPDPNPADASVNQQAISAADVSSVDESPSNNS